VEVGGEGGQKRFWLEKRMVSRDLLITNQRVPIYYHHIWLLSTGQELN
jgi:hypothetical protein